MKESPLSHKYTKVEDRADLMVKEGTKPGQIMETGDIVQIIAQDKIIEATDLEKISEGRQNNRDNYRNERYGSNYRDRNKSRERTLTRRDRSSSNDRSRSGPRASTNRDRIRCYACRDYDHFVRDCPNSREERDLEQLQQMLNMEEQHHWELSTLSSDEDYKSPLNLWMVGMMPPHSYC